MFLNRWNSSQTTFAAIAILIALAYPVWSIMLRPDLDLWRTDDAGETHLLRFYAVQRALADAPSFPRWIASLYRGYGYPIFTYYSPLVYLAAIPGMALGLSPWDAFRALGVASIVLGGTGTYALIRVTSPTAKRIDSHVPAIVAGLLYVVAPYPFIINLYLRGDLPEALGLGLLPWFLVGVDRCLTSSGRPRLSTIVPAAAVGASIFLAHQLTGVLAFVSAVAWLIGRLAINPRATVRNFASLATSGIVAAGLVAFLAVPSLLELGAVHYEHVRMSLDELLEKLVEPGSIPRPIIVHGEAALVLPGLIDWAWTYTYPWGIAPTFAPMKVAATHAVIAVLSVVLAIGAAFTPPTRTRTVRWTQPAPSVTAPIAGPVLLVLTMWWANTTWSDAVWIRIPELRLVQFPWRLYGPFSLGVAVAAGMALDAGAHRAKVTRWLGYLAGAASVCALAFAALASPPIPFTTGVSHNVAANTQLASEYNRDTWISGAATGFGEFTPVDVELHASDPMVHRGNQVFDRRFPPGAWAASTALIYAGEARFSEIRRDGLSLQAVVDVGAGGAIVAFHQLWFPGWRAFVDGTEVPHRLPAYDPATDTRLGFQLVDVPEGNHVVTSRFGATLPRIAGDLITTGTLASVAGVAMINTVRSRRYATRFTNLMHIASAAILLTAFCAAVWQVGYETVLSVPPVSRLLGTNVLVADVPTIVRTGKARISSPSGSDLGADKFVDIGWQLVGPLVAGRPGIVEFPHGGRMRQWLYMHPPSRVAFDVTVTDRDTFFTAGMALRPEAWYTDYGDGVRFAVDIATAGSHPVEIYGQRLNPRANVDERRWVEVRLPLAAYLGKSIEITLRTDPVDDVRNDWAGWGNPMVVVDHTLLRPENGPDVPTNVGPRPTFR